jgi:hypothetical protein
MGTRACILGLALVLLLTGTVAHADTTQPLRCTVAGSSVVGVETNLDTNGDDISASATQSIMHCGRFRFFVQSVNESPAPVPPTENCPAGSTLEYPLLQSHGVRTEERTGDQLFARYTAGALCVQPDATFTFTGTGVFVGGTGRFTGATGTIETQLAGSYVVAGSRGDIFSALTQFTGTSTETLTLPQDRD